MKSYHLIIVLIVFIFSGCGNEVSTSTKDGSVTITMAILDGTWIEECKFISSSSTSVKRAYVFSGHSIFSRLSEKYVFCCIRVWQAVGMDGLYNLFT